MSPTLPPRPSPRGSFGLHSGLSTARAGRRLHGALALCLLTCALAAGSGCAAIRGALRPLVCECEADETEDGAGDEFAGHEHEHEHEPSDGDEGEELAGAGGESEPEDTDRPNEALVESELVPIEVVLTDALVPEATQEIRAREYGISSLPPQSHLLTGDFSRRPGGEAFVVIPNLEVAVYGESGRVAREEMALSIHDAFPPATLAVADLGLPVQAVDLVSDGTHQVIVATVESDADGQTLVWMTVLKTIGGRVGRIFRAPLARIGADGYEPVGRVDFLRGRQHRVLRYTPLDEGEASGWSEATLFRWNRWEGVYRIPVPPPTAPRS